MKCQEIMKKDVECVSPQDTAEEAARRMRDRNIGFLPVCKPGDTPIGTVTDRDLAIRVVAEGRSPASCRIDDVLTREVIACRPEDDIRKAEQLMARHKKSRVLVVDAQGKLCGVISLSDVIASETDERAAAATMRQVVEREVHA